MASDGKEPDPNGRHVRRAPTVQPRAVRRLTTQSGTAKQPIRVMLAGTPFSGKTCVFNQFRFEATSLDKYVAAHHDFLVTAIRTKLLREYKKFMQLFRVYVCLLSALAWLISRLDSCSRQGSHRTCRVSHA